MLTFMRMLALVFKIIWKNSPNVLIKKIEYGFRLNLYSIDLKNEIYTKEVMQTVDRSFFAFGRFPAINELTIVPTGNVPSFVQLSDFIPLSQLYKKI